MRPEEFQDLVDFVAVLRAPTSVWLPSEWASGALMSYLNGFFDWLQKIVEPLVLLSQRIAELFLSRHLAAKSGLVLRRLGSLGQFLSELLLVFF